MPKNYYIILGVPSTSSQDQIKTAYRQLAKEYHPDRYGKGRTPFQVIQEAYSVLSDPIQRQDYDSRREQQWTPPQQKTTTEPMTSPVVPEPLIPQQHPTGLGDTMPEKSLGNYGFSFDSLFDNILGPFRERRETEDNRSARLNVTVHLTPDQAYKGGSARITVPLKIACPTCRGHGGMGYYECWRCGGDGFLEGEYPLMINYPAGISDSHTVQITLDRLGIPGLSLSIRFRLTDLL